MPRDKRGQCRYLIDGECTIRYKDRHRLIEVPAWLADMSNSGLRVAMASPPESGTAVMVTVEGAEEQPLFGRIVHGLAAPTSGRYVGIQIVQGTLPFDLFQKLIRDAVVETAVHRTPKCYQRLGLPFPSTKEQIHVAFRRLSMTAHPDHGGNEKEFIALHAAYREALGLCS